MDGEGGGWVCGGGWVGGGGVNGSVIIRWNNYRVFLQIVRAELDMA